MIPIPFASDMPFAPRLLRMASSPKKPFGMETFVPVPTSAMELPGMSVSVSA